LCRLIGCYIAYRNNSSQLLDTYAENAMAFNRLMLTQITISESMGSSYSACSGNPFFSSESSGSPKFYIGDMSEDEDSHTTEHHLEEPLGRMAIPAKGSSTADVLKLSPPSSSLAQRRKCRFNSVGGSPPSSPSL